MFFRANVFLPLVLALGAISHAPCALADVKSTVPRATILETKVISADAEHYHGWPTVTRRKNGQLVLVYSGGRLGHVDPFGRVEMMVSSDDGKTWGTPRVILDTDMDDRDAGVLETARGSLLVTTFTSLADEGVLEKAQQDAAAGTAKGWTPERFALWNAARNRLTPEQRKAQLGEWMLRSTDGGLPGRLCHPLSFPSPHGPIQLRDGRLLYAGNKQFSDGNRRGICESTDDGKTWHWLADLPVRPGDDPLVYWEMHAVETDDNRILVQIRNDNLTNNNKETLQCESSDGGKTWSVPHSIGVWGLPPHLLKLRNGNLLMTYGYRRAPFGNQARLSKDGGRTWSSPLTISSDGIGGDLGYPSTVELADGTLITIWYERLASSDKAVLRQAHWRLN